MPRGFAPVAVVLLLAVTVLAAGAVAVAMPALPGEPPPQRAVAVDATADGRVAVTLLSGDAIDVRDATLRIAVGGDALRHQPPVPFFAARGFRGGPTGPFNVAADPAWTVGETAAVRIAGTNSPVPASGDTVTVRVLVHDHVVAAADATVEDAASGNAHLAGQPTAARSVGVFASLESATHASLRRAARGSLRSPLAQSAASLRSAARLAALYGRRSLSQRPHYVRALGPL